MTTSKKIVKPSDAKSDWFQNFFMLFVIGFFIILIGIIILMVASILSNESVNLGALVFIGPFPIVVGVGPEAKWVILFSIIIAVVSIVTSLLLRKELEKANV